MIAWGWLIPALITGFFLGAMVIRYKGNKDMEILAGQVKDTEDRVKKIKEDIDGKSKTRIS
ncbi:hypothetical protein KKE60_08295 [Patescibacteria group bacterium]|nr:hypothetical protein [Patescibacteria group bacterium]